MKDYFILSYSKNCDLESVKNAADTLQYAFPDKGIIVLPETINFQEYSKEELIELLKKYSKYMEKLINEK